MQNGFRIDSVFAHVGRGETSFIPGGHFVSMFWQQRAAIPSDTLREGLRAKVNGETRELLRAFGTYMNNLTANGAWGLLWILLVDPPILLLGIFGGQDIDC